MASYQLSQQELRRINQDLKDLEDIADDLKQAQDAGVPNVEFLLDACDTCKQRIIALKKVYAKGKK